MPELPEVQTIADELRPLLRGKVFSRLWAAHEPMLRRPGSARQFLGALRGQKVLDVGRRGKLVWLTLSHRKNLFIHQKFGHLVYGRWKLRRGVWMPADETTERLSSDPANNFLRLVFTFADGSALALSDIRKFGRVYALTDDEIAGVPELQVGLDPLGPNFHFRALQPKLLGRRCSIKELLLNQQVIAGIGNIYADEVLWKAGIHPLRPAGRLTTRELQRLARATVAVLKRAVAAKGASMLTYRRPNGEAGGYGSLRYVYQRSGEPCLRCGSAIVRLVHRGRSAHFCSQCQG
ncbi:MAG: bifunctional DNA-formamidopyrimidine glycosylase/DNA-(apurinic or apyrimidinic site) lyase [bacterium]|nr:bifunctional DNA-formamidopyrimidine glycosylase/DNA-(apurinic or apyrimidinic site) lyase [bacterium]MDZ4296541.1 bifunctional DNA-formamidopyrimidine glycosylase/DNA-(apurinic or apyrimidinic site) lyase [Patescibacteria group bacterium]